MRGARCPAVSVLESFTLPEQPSAGGLRYAALGGDGNSAPIGCFQGNANVVGDASAGLAQIRVDFDRQYTTLVTYARGYARALGATADVSFETFSFKSSPDVTATQWVAVGELDTVAAAIVLDNASKTVYPPPTMFPASDSGALRVNFANSNGVTFGLQFEMFVFDANILQKSAYQAFAMARSGMVAWSET